MSQQTRLLSFDFQEDGPLKYCPVQADLAVHSPDYDFNGPDSPLVLGCILTIPVAPFNALNAGQHGLPWLSLRNYGIRLECSSTATCSLAHRHDELGFTFNGDLVSEIRATTDKIRTFSLERDQADAIFNKLLSTEPVQSLLKDRQTTELYMVNRIQVAKGLEISHLTEVHFKSNLGPDVRDEMKHILVPRLDREVIVGYGLRKYILSHEGGLSSANGGWTFTPDRVYFDPNGGIACLDR